MSVQTQAVQYTHGDSVLEGLLAWSNESASRRPGVLVAHAWGGRSDFEDQVACRLAGLGYAAFALDLYGKGVQGKSKDENAALMKPFMDDRVLLKSRLAESLKALAQCDYVDPDRLAIIGYCFGGLCAIDLARSGSSIKGAVSIHGLFHAPEYPITINAKILALHGWDDPMATPEQALAFANEMTAADADWQMHAYGRTMHAFTNPKANDPEFGTVYNADADRRSWQAIENFLAEVLV